MSALFKSMGDVVGGSLPSVNGTINITASWPSHTTNDLGVLIVSAGRIPSPDPVISGWTRVGIVTANGNPGNRGLLIYVKRAASGSEPDVTCPITTTVSTGGTYKAVVMVLEGVNETAAILSYDFISGTAATKFNVDASGQVEKAMPGFFTSFRKTWRNLTVGFCSLPESQNAASFLGGRINWDNAFGALPHLNSAGSNGLLGICSTVEPAFNSLLDWKFGVSGCVNDASDFPAIILQFIPKVSEGAPATQIKIGISPSSFTGTALKPASSAASISLAGDFNAKAYRDAAFTSSIVMAADALGTAIRSGYFTSQISFAPSPGFTSGGVLSSNFQTTIQLGGSFVGSAIHSSSVSATITFLGLFTAPSFTTSEFSSQIRFSGVFQPILIEATTVQDGSSGTGTVIATVDWSLCDYSPVELQPGNGIFKIRQVKPDPGKSVKVVVLNPNGSSGSLVWENVDFGEIPQPEIPPVNTFAVVSLFSPMFGKIVCLGHEGGYAI